jgi:hypothetical protein
MNRVFFAIVVGLLLAIGFSGFNQSNDYSSTTDESFETTE